MGFWGLGLGRSRTRLGKWMDDNEITQMDLHKWSGVSRPTITKLCSEKDYEPSDLIKRTVIAALRRRGFDVDEDDFWN